MVGVHNGMLRVELRAPPVDGAANKELIRFIAATLGLRRSDVSLTSGQTGRRKRLRVNGIAKVELVDTLWALCDPQPEPVLPSN